MAESKKVAESLASLAEKIDQSKVTRQGQIVLRLSGEDGGNFSLNSSAGKTELADARLSETTPLIEIMGDADVICSILDGEKDAVKQFLSGGIRVRGDLRYFSDLALELGIIDSPL